MSSILWNTDSEEKYKAPMPWIGAYVAAASLVCSLAMAADAFHGFRHKKLWFPCRFFTLNAAFLTLLAVTTKLAVDLSTAMPRAADQLAKLSSTVLMSTVMGNFMPSLGAMDNKEIFMNITALGILVITILVNLCIQLGTGILYPGIGLIYPAGPALLVEHTLVMLFLLVLFVILSFSALSVPTTKKYLELKYDEIHKMASNEGLEGTGKFTVEKLKEDVKKYWMMAESGSPQFVIARSVTCSASGAICFLTATILAEAELRTFLMFKLSAYDNTGFASDYVWSTVLILVIQSIGVGVGTIAATFRWFTAISFKCSKKGSNRYKTEFKTENYWTQKLVEWKESPLTLSLRGRKCRKLVQGTKTLILDFCIRVQIVIVVASKLVQLFSVFFISPFLSCCRYCMGLKRKLISKSRALEHKTGSEPTPYLGRYVLHLEGEEELPDRILKDIRDAPDYLIQRGKKQQPKNLMELLERPTGFEGAAEFDSDQVPSLDSQEPPNCWMLPVVTLTSIAIALPNIANHMVDRLLSSVSEGLLYVSIVEKNLDAKGDLINIRNAADIAWLGVDLYHKWLDQDLRRMALEGKTSEETLERLADIAKNCLGIQERHEWKSEGEPFQLAHQGYCC